MSLKTFLKEKLKTLCDYFNESAWPEPEIREEMEQEGWKFEILHPAAISHYGAMCMPLIFVTTPEGRPAYNGNSDPADEARFRQVLAQKRIAHGLKP